MIERILYLKHTVESHLIYISVVPFFIAQEMSINSEAFFRVTLRKMKYLFVKIKENTTLDHDLPVTLAPGTRVSKKISNIFPAAKCDVCTV